MPNQRRDGLVSLHIYTRPEVKAEFAAATRERGETMTAVLTRLMRNYIVTDAECKHVHGVYVAALQTLICSACGIVLGGPIEKG